MTRTLLIFIVATLLAACSNNAKTPVDFNTIDEYVETPDEYADSINGYATFSAHGRITVIPEKITEREYRRLLTDKYTLKTVEIDTNSQLFDKLDSMTRNNARRYDLLRGYADTEDEILVERRMGCESRVSAFYHYPSTKQYECAILAPLTVESFMMAENGKIDSTFMQSETRTYGSNGIFVGQKGHDCDFHGSLWYYWYDSEHHRMVPLCHYLDYRWSEDGGDFNLCWINDSVLLVAAVSTGNIYGWVGGYKPQNAEPWGTPVYYKLLLRVD